MVIHAGRIVRMHMITIPHGNGNGNAKKSITTVPAVAIRFAGDSGDGMQLTGTVAGVSGYQIQFSNSDIFTSGDDVDALVALNPAAFPSNIKSVKLAGIVTGTETWNVG
jgi:2-oxoglutarate ferredoxin oxidoreductase subunit alpha